MAITLYHLRLRLPSIPVSFALRVQYGLTVEKQWGWAVGEKDEWANKLLFEGEVRFHRVGMQYHNDNEYIKQKVA